MTLINRSKASKISVRLSMVAFADSEKIDFFSQIKKSPDSLLNENYIVQTPLITT